MKEGIHPTYYPEAQVKCACGAAFAVGSTMKEIEVEICSACHPFYTGMEKMLDTAGRVEKFKARSAQAEAAHAKRPATPSKKSKAPAKTTLAKLAGATRTKAKAQK